MEGQIQKENDKIVKKYICEVCNYETNIKHSYQLHELSLKHIEKLKTHKQHNTIYSRMCSTCGKIFTHKSSLSRHKKNCISIAKFEGQLKPINFEEILNSKNIEIKNYITELKKKDMIIKNNDKIIKDHVDNIKWQNNVINMYISEVSLLLKMSEHRVNKGQIYKNFILRNNYDDDEFYKLENEIDELEIISSNVIKGIIEEHKKNFNPDAIVF